MAENKTQDERVTCKVCGKVLTREQSMNNEIGHRCDTLIQEGWTGEKLAKHYAGVTGKIPEGFIKVADLHRAIDAKKAGIPGLTVSKMVKAIGKDRALEGPIHPIAKPIYDDRRVRWVNPWLATTDGLNAIATGDYSKAPEA
ncbi:MAG: hypothetical protein AMJ53_18595 [Gammaproteobacteria bacterium SG8_11]|nr:MAG: hypothetical protein AMJ53_18595 [Gammaproteobacteria bacterium SG8_11]